MTDAKIAIADDHPLFRAALKQAIAECFVDEVSLEVDNFQDLLALIDAQPSIELVFLDLHMPGNDGFSGLSMLQNHHPDLVVIMVSSQDDQHVMQKAIHLGAAAFIPKSADLTVINQAINTVLDGEVWLPDNMVIDTDEKTKAEQQTLAKQLAQLTPQQFVVLKLIADGQLNKQIAYDLDIKETTVKKHVSAILTKLAVNNRTLAGLKYQQLMQATEPHLAS
ncbi:response regulator transcription factor [Thalassotalea ponticola]|uniref:response regulator transcription factor n=1 Tax=Thalassotalea ponticola TaxID=1523392 RepID=UPI0025B2F403|nr:response regulator transcription factor [Thalassotalea ponticola]MDN3653139.1 response regulator transcription factor [Thalassotalea ponticola]